VRRVVGTLRLQSVEGHVQAQDIDAWLADQAEKASFDMLRDQVADPGFRQAARLGDARDLEERGGGRDVRIEAARRRRD